VCRGRKFSTPTIAHFNISQNQHQKNTVSQLFFDRWNALILLRFLKNFLKNFKFLHFLSKNPCIGFLSFVTLQKKT